MNAICLMYHDIYENSPDESGFGRESMLQYKLSFKLFEEHVKTIKEYTDLHKDLRVLFTFDDGGVSSYNIAARILEEYGMKGLFFVCPQYINLPGFVNNLQLIELEKRGHLIGSHSFSHPENLNLLDKKDKEKEWRESLEYLENLLGHTIQEVSIPNGYFDKECLGILRKNDVKHIYTSKPTTKVEEKGSFLIYGRYVVHCGMQTKDIISILSSRNRRLWLELKWSMIEMLKIVFGSHYSDVKIIIMRLLWNLNIR